jgi:hypothetical protein
MKERVVFDTVFVRNRAHGTGMAASPGKRAPMPLGGTGHENALLYQVFSCPGTQESMEFLFTRFC